MSALATQAAVATATAGTKWNLWGAIVGYGQQECDDGADATGQAKHCSNYVTSAVAAAACPVHGTASSAAAAAAMYHPTAAAAHTHACANALQRRNSCSGQRHLSEPICGYIH